MFTLDTGIKLRRGFWWSFSCSTQLGNGANLYKEPMKPSCERGGFAAPLPALRMGRRMDELMDGDPCQPQSREFVSCKSGCWRNAGTEAFDTVSNNV